MFEQLATEEQVRNAMGLGHSYLYKFFIQMKLSAETGLRAETLEIDFLQGIPSGFGIKIKEISVTLNGKFANALTRGFDAFTSDPSTCFDNPVETYNPNYLESDNTTTGIDEGGGGISDTSKIPFFSYEMVQVSTANASGVQGGNSPGHEQFVNGIPLPYGKLWLSQWFGTGVAASQILTARGNVVFELYEISTGKQQAMFRDILGEAVR
jgi:hypothetical protein